jgi:hypothetical protein
MRYLAPAIGIANRNRAEQDRFIGVVWDIIKQLQPSWAITNRLAGRVPAKAARGASARYMGMEALQVKTRTFPKSGPRENQQG